MNRNHSYEDLEGEHLRLRQWQLSPEVGTSSVSLRNKKKACGLEWLCTGGREVIMGDEILKGPVGPHRIWQRNRFYSKCGGKQGNSTMT